MHLIISKAVVAEHFREDLFVAQLRLREPEASDALLVRAIEVEDAAGLALTQEDRVYATSAALGGSSEGVSLTPQQTSAFVARRAAYALDRLIARYPTLQRVRSFSMWPSWLSWGVPFGAFVIGTCTNVLDGQRLNILAFPLLTTIIWNLAVYVVILGRLVLHALPRGTPKSAAGRFDWLIRPVSAPLAGQPTLERGVVRYARDWRAAAGRLTSYRVGRSLHLGAAMFACGILAGMLVRARYSMEYTAGWSGTWAGAETEISKMLKFVLGPASAISGIDLPTIARLRQLRGADENAGNWLVLWALTTALLVILPRLILAVLYGLRASTLARRVVIPDDFYLRSLLRNALGRASTARVVPYALDMPTDARERVVQLLRGALGDRTNVRVEQTVPYGGEDDWLAQNGNSLSDDDQLIFLFSLASTPEAENQGTLIAGAKQRLTPSGTAVLALLDEGGFTRKLRGNASAGQRVDERLNSWKTVLGPSNIPVIKIRLDTTDATNGARVLEETLLRSTVPA